MAPEKGANKKVPPKLFAKRIDLKALNSHVEFKVKSVGCGISALVISLRAAIEALKIKNVDLGLINFKFFYSLLESPEYAAEVQDKLDSIFNAEEITLHRAQQNIDSNEGRASKAAVEFYDEQNQALIWKEELELEQLSMLLVAANKRLGTNFRLGQIIQGYNCRWDDKKKMFENNFFRESTAQLNDGSDPGTPVIFICNNNSVARHEAHNIRDVPGGHWEGFARTTTRNEEQRRRQEIQDWGIEPFISADIAVGVYLVLETSGGEEGHLNVQAGHFVRDIDPPDGVVVPPGWRHMRASNYEDIQETYGGRRDMLGESGAGLIEETRLERLEMHRNAPKPLGTLYRVPASTGTEQTADDIEALMADFRILRTIPPSDKVGNEVNEYELVDAFRYNVGDFLYKRGLSVVGRQFFRDIIGAEGGAYLKNLQLLHRPWGLPDQLPILPDFIFTALDGMPNLRAECAKRGFKAGQSKKKTFEKIQEHENNRSSDLPLYLITKVYAGLRGIAKDAVGSHVGEVVYVETIGGKRTKLTDYEGREGEVPTEDLLRIRNAFGIRTLKDENAPLRSKKRPRDDDDRPDLAAPPPKK